MKNNGGYILPYVLVVMTILSLVAVSIMSNTLMGLQTQQKSIERMEAKYAAEGEIEEMLAQLCVLSFSALDSKEEVSNIADAIKTELEKLDSGSGIFIDNNTIDVTPAEVVKGQTAEFTCEFQIKASNDGATISCTPHLKGKITSHIVKSKDNMGVEQETYVYKLSEVDITYNAYEITYS